MTKILPISLAFVACGTSETPPSDTPSEGDLVVTGAQTSPDGSTEDALAVSSAMAVSFQVDEVPDWLPDGELRFGQFTEEERCFSVLTDTNELTVVFETCDRAAGTIVIDVPRFGPTTFNFQDDFTIDGRDLDGSLTLDAVVVDRQFELSGSLVLDGNTDIDTDLTVEALNGPTVWGSLAIDDGGRSFTVTTGTEAAPLTWTLDCTCPVSGAIEGDVQATLDTLTIDYDDLVAPFDGEDDFPPFEVPVTPVPITSDLLVDFEPGCGAQTVDVVATDVEIVVSNDDLRAPLDEACANGGVDAEDCDRAGRVLDNLAEDITILVPTETLAESVEGEIDDLLTVTCTGL